ncbi:hypothetical protein [Nocardia brasiliensis]|uniref:hypothetical protein n=1 Tax=Nocardia brasiliensis TaxID=37326 RepID=UPI002458D4D3|nr:hypothetical protein [Nocardia brasiliensis]
MSTIRKDLHRMVDELPEAELRPAVELLRGVLAASAAHDLPFAASFEAEPDLSERYEAILRTELGR